MEKEIAVVMRNQALQTNRWLGQYLLSLQAFEKAKPSFPETREDKAERTRFAKTQCDKIPGLDPLPAHAVHERTYAPPFRWDKEYPKRLGSAIAGIFSIMGFQTLVFLPIYRGAKWVGDASSDPQVHQAQATILSLIPEKSFDGGVLVPLGLLDNWLLNLLTMTSESPELARILFAVDDQATAFHICQHGILHQFFADEAMRRRFEESWLAHGFQEIDNCRGWVDAQPPPC